MGRAAHASGRSRTALGVVLGVVLTLLLPALATSDATMTAVVLALTVLLVLAPSSLSRPTCGRLATAPIGDAPPPALFGRVTDPLHHPLRPRAPAQA